MEGMDVTVGLKWGSIYWLYLMILLDLVNFD